MKKTLSTLLALIMIFVFTTSCMASNTFDQHKGKHKGIIKKALKQKYEERVKEKTQTEEDSDQIADVQNHWAAHSIQNLNAIGLINCYPDKTFKPDNSITQAEIITLISKLIDDENINEDNEDIDDEDLDNVPDWAKGYTKKAAKLGFLNLNRFHSNVQATRAQTAVWIAKAIGIEPDLDDIPFKDGLLISKEDIGYIAALYQEGYIIGIPGGKFNPDSSITRAEIAAILERILADDEDELNDTIVSISLNPKTKTLEQGESFTLTATVKNADEDNVTWFSTNTYVAAVDEDGVVTAADNRTGTAKIIASITEDGITKSASCIVEVVKDIEESASLVATGRTGTHDGKVYQEFELRSHGEQISLDEDNIFSMTITRDDGNKVTLTPTSDDCLWFNVQKPTGFYDLDVEDNDGVLYEATLDWDAPEEVEADLTGHEKEIDGDEYAEYEISNLDMSDAEAIYQILPDETIDELTVDDSDSGLWINTDDQQDGENTFVIFIDGDWYTTTIDF